MSFDRSIIVLLLAWGTASGQRLAPVAPAAAAKPDAPLGETRIVEDIIAPKLHGKDLAALYRKFTGRRVIVAVAAATAEFSFVQEASPDKPLTYAQAAERLKKSATIENFVFTPDNEDPNLDILTLATSKLRHGPCGSVSVYTESEPLPAGDPVISYVMMLKYLKPANAVTVFTRSTGPGGPYDSIAVVPNASAIVITGKTSRVRALIDLKREIDSPLAALIIHLCGYCLPP
jgi:general secretion pathway protein D